MNSQRFAAGSQIVWWSVTGLVAVCALSVTWEAKGRKADLFATYLGDLLVLFIVFDIANPNPKAFGFGLLGAAIKAGMTLMRAHKLKKEQRE